MKRSRELLVAAALVDLPAFVLVKAIDFFIVIYLGLHLIDGLKRQPVFFSLRLVLQLLDLACDRLAGFHFVDFWKSERRLVDGTA